MWKSFRSLSGMSKATFNQRAVGHQAIRPTTIATNYPEVIELDGDSMITNLTEQTVPFA